jgi:hypothetical protein
MKSAKLTAFLFFISLAAFAQNTPSAITPNTIYIGADGKFEAAPDTAVITFGISAQEATSREAYDHASRSSQQVRDLLSRNGVDPKSAEISYFSLEPVYDYKNPKRKLIAYRGNSSVTLKLKDFTKVGPILQGLADLDISDNQQISYILDNIDEGKIKASQDALQRAKLQAAAVSTTAGRTLGDLIYVSVDTFEPPRPIPMAYAKAGVATMAAQAPTEQFSAQKITVTAHVNAMFALK